MMSKEQVLKSVSDIYSAGSWIFLCCTEEYSWAPKVVNDYVKVMEELSYEPGSRPEEDSIMYEGIRVWGRERYLPGEGKVFVLGSATDRDAEPETLAITDQYFTWLATESTIEMMMFFGKIDGELASMVRGFPGNVLLFFMDVDGPEIIEQFPDLRYASPDLADPQSLTPGWISSIRNDYSYYSYSNVSTVPEPVPQPAHAPMPAGGNVVPPEPEEELARPRFLRPGDTWREDPTPEPVHEPVESPREVLLRKRALRYDSKEYVP